MDSTHSLHNTSRVQSLAGSGSQPKLLASFGSQSTLGRQVKSTKSSSYAYSVSTRDTFREPSGVRLARQATGTKTVVHASEKVYMGEAHQRHIVPDTPGPGQYQHRMSMGKQVLTRAKSPVSFSFSTSDRFGYIDRQLKKTATPGPGRYVA